MLRGEQVQVQCLQDFVAKLRAYHGMLGIFVEERDGKPWRTNNACRRPAATLPIDNVRRIAYATIASWIYNLSAIIISDTNKRRPWLFPWRRLADPPQWWQRESLKEKTSYCVHRESRWPRGRLDFRDSWTSSAHKRRTPAWKRRRKTTYFGKSKMSRQHSVT